MLTNVPWNVPDIVPVVLPGESAEILILPFSAYTFVINTFPFCIVLKVKNASESILSSAGVEGSSSLKSRTVWSPVVTLFPTDVFSPKVSVKRYKLSVEIPVRSNRFWFNGVDLNKVAAPCILKVSNIPLILALKVAEPVVFVEEESFLQELKHTNNTEQNKIKRFFSWFYIFV